MASDEAPTVSVAPIAAPVKRQVEELRPASSSRHVSRPTSSHNHERQGSAGSSSSGVSNRPSVRIHN
jgi:hypothetical protein